MSQKSNAKIISLSIRPELLKLVDDFAEKTFRTRAGVFEMMIVNFFQNNDKANLQPTATLETDAQQPDDTTEEPSSVPEWNGISGRTAPLPDSWKK